jgi:predicted DNA-binding transcriptional regulator AlpA
MAGAQRRGGEELLSAGDVARLLKVTGGRVRQLALAGQLPEPAGLLPGGRRVWRRADVERWMRRRAAQG